MTDLYTAPVTAPDGSQTDLSAWRDHVMLIVNVASKCGFTPQYAGLESLYRAHGGKGLVVIGFPCNQFGGQEPGSAAEIASFCSTSYDVTFPIMGKVDVNGPDAAPVWRVLKKAAPGLLGSEAIKWNFTKFLVDRQGRVAGRYAPTTTPQAIEADIQQLLQR
ncbi:glutathione peroxidase [Sphingomonas sp.]|uniref:glutathione peroxidase n=1 Tax=Sphingomonas sp. TaxID=28214 RepID=UPI002CD50192|nr:glutathione peroxidase [Sphingomonas sp.]HTG39252.1 glutathione peroxidase [Sphingomonas sp.]